jgi:hypothetical protein
MAAPEAGIGSRGLALRGGSTAGRLPPKLADHATGWPDLKMHGNVTIKGDPLEIMLA